MLILVRSLSNAAHASFSEESILILMLVLVRSLSYTPQASFSEASLLHTSYQF